MLIGTTWFIFGTWVASALQRGFLLERRREIGVFVNWTSMNSSIKYEDRLEGVSNYLQRKERIAVVMRENKLWMFVSTKMVTPSSDPIA